MKVFLIEGVNNLLNGKWKVVCTEDKFQENLARMSEWYDEITVHELVLNKYDSAKLLAFSPVAG